MSKIVRVVGRGAYMSVTSSMMQLAGGFGSWISGVIVVQSPSGALSNFHFLGWIVVITMALTLAQMFNINRMIR